MKKTIRIMLMLVMVSLCLCGCGRLNGSQVKSDGKALIEGDIRKEFYIKFKLYEKNLPNDLKIDISLYDSDNTEITDVSEGYEVYVYDIEGTYMSSSINVEGEISGKYVVVSDGKAVHIQRQELEIN